MSDATPNMPAAAPELGSPAYWITEMQKAGAPQAAVAEYATKHGLSLPGAAQPTDGTPPTEQVVHKATPSPVPPNSGPSAAAWLDQMKASGAPQEELRKAAHELGMTPAEYDSLNAGPTALDEHLTRIGFAPAESPLAFSMPKVAGDTPAEIVANDMAFREVLHEARFPVEIGNAVAAQAAAYEQKWQAMSESDRAVEANNSRAMLARLWGADYQSNLAGVQQFVEELDAKVGGKLIPWLESSGVGNSVNVAAQLAQHVARIKARAPATK